MSDFGDLRENFFELIADCYVLCVIEFNEPAFGFADFIEELIHF